MLELTLIVGSAGFFDPRFHSRVGLKAIEEDLLQKYVYIYIYSLCFLNIFMESWNWNFVEKRRFFLGASGEGLFPQAPANGFS